MFSPYQYCLLSPRLSTHIGDILNAKDIQLLEVYLNVTEEMKMDR